MSGDGRFSLESTKVLVIENIKVWIIYGVGFVGLVCFVELVIWGKWVRHGVRGIRIFYFYYVCGGSFFWISYKYVDFWMYY